MPLLVVNGRVCDTLLVLLNSYIMNENNAIQSVLVGVAPPSTTARSTDSCCILLAVVSCCGSFVRSSNFKFQCTLSCVVQVHGFRE